MTTLIEKLMASGLPIRYIVLKNNRKRPEVEDIDSNFLIREVRMSQSGLLETQNRDIANGALSILNKNLGKTYVFEKELNPETKSFVIGYERKAN